jgi:dihydrofolate reductase
MTNDQVQHTTAAAMAAVEFVVAVAENDVIGRDNKLPWRLPADLRHFKALTLGKTVLMGRRTFESIGKALPGRDNLVLTRTPHYEAAGCSVVGSVEEARRRVGAGGPLMVIGGAEVYRVCLPVVRRIHLTVVHTHAHGDAFFSAWHEPRWREHGREVHRADEKNLFDYTFLTLEQA